MSKTVEERLNDIVEEKEERIEELEQFNSLVDTAYQRHFTIPNSGIREGLPYPRMEMIWKYNSENKDYGGSWTSGIVMLPYNFLRKERLLFVPLNKTTTTQGHNIIREGKHELPFRDGMDFPAQSYALGLPAYLVNEEDGHVEKIDTDSVGNKKWMEQMKSE